MTDLAALREFAGLEANPLVRRLALVNAVEQLADRAVWITIGNADDRVDTDKAVALARALARAATALGLPPRITLQVLPVPGHVSQAEWHDQAVTWLDDRNTRKD